MKALFRTGLIGIAALILTSASQVSALPTNPAATFTKYKITTPKDAPFSQMLGMLRINSWNPVTITPYEDNTRLYFLVTNTGSTERTIEHMSLGNLTVDGKPNVKVTIHRQFGSEANSRTASVTIAAGQTKSLEFTIERFLTGDNRSKTSSKVPFTFRSVEDNASTTIKIDVTSYWFDPTLEMLSTAYISGRVTNSAGKPIAGARVSAGLFAMVNVRSATTNSNGQFRLGVLSLPDVQKLLGKRPLPYGPLKYFVTVDAKGYATVDRTVTTLSKGKTVTVNTKHAAVKMLNYKQVGSFASNGTLAYWWVDFAGDRVIATQGQHPPVSERTGHVVAISLTGKELWRQTTGGQCWGFDVSDDKTLVAVGCDDGYVYVNRVSDGALLYKKRTGDRPGDSVLNSVEFSPDSRYLAVDGTGGEGGFTVLHALTGEVYWTSTKFTTGPVEQWAYKIRWSHDGKRIAVADNGLVSSFTADGNFEWRQVTGYLTFNVDFDGNGNLYVGTKDHQLISYDPQGNERWRRTVSQVPQMSLRLFGADASYLVSPSFDGMVQAFDFNGDLLWQHIMPATTVKNGPRYWVPGIGHNAAMMSADGSLLAVASRGYETTVYDRNGNLLWYHVATARKDFKGDDPESHGHMTGGQALAMTPDGKMIAVGYADSVIRIFERR